MVRDSLEKKNHKNDKGPRLAFSLLHLDAMSVEGGGDVLHFLLAQAVDDGRAVAALLGIDERSKVAPTVFLVGNFDVLRGKRRLNCLVRFLKCTATEAVPNLACRRSSSGQRDP